MNFNGKNKVEFFTAVEPRKVLFWPTPGFKNRAFDNSGFFEHGTLISASAVPNRRCYGRCSSETSPLSHWWWTADQGEEWSQQSRLNIDLQLILLEAWWVNNPFSLLLVQSDRRTISLTGLKTLINERTDEASKQASKRPTDRPIDRPTDWLS